MKYQRRILFRKVGIFLSVLLLGSWIGTSGTVYAEGPSLNVGEIISEPAVEENWADLPQLEPTDDGEVPTMYEVGPEEIQRLKQEAAGASAGSGSFTDDQTGMDGQVDAAVETDDSAASDMEGTAERESLPAPVPEATPESGNAEDPTDRSSLAPALKNDFISVNYGTGGFLRPADPVVAVGPSHVGVMVNSYVRFHTKSGTNVASASMSSFFASVRPSGTRTPFDPKIIYDHHDNRWVMLILTYNNANKFNGSWWLLAVSKTSDPTDTTNGWYKWAIRADIGTTFSGTWADYPGLGFDDYFLYITSNMYAPSGLVDPDSTFDEAQLYVIDKATLYNGGSFTAASWSNFEWPGGSNLFTMKPAHVFGSGKRFYGVNTQSGGGNQLHVWHAAFTTPGSASWDRHVINVSSYAVPPNAEQQGGSALIDTLDCRIEDPVQYRNGRLYTAYPDRTNWGTAKTVSWVRGVAINTSTWTTDMDWGFGAPNSHYFMPALYSDPLGNVIMVFNRSSTEEYASIRYTATQRHKYNSWEGSRLLKAGEDYYTGFRWGDYNGIAADPSDPYKLWFTAMYAHPTGGNWWGTWVGSAKPGVEITSTYPVYYAEPGRSVWLWAWVLNKSSADPVWFYVNGPSWTGSHWVGSQTTPNGGGSWHGYNWTVPAARTPGAHTYWARAYNPSATLALSPWSSGRGFAVEKITRLWQPTPAAQRGSSSFLWAEVLGKPANDQVWFWVTGPGWTGNNWVGFQTTVNGGGNWYGYSWFISNSRPAGSYSYWARVYTAPPYNAQTSWKGPENFPVR